MGLMLGLLAAMAIVISLLAIGAMAVAFAVTVRKTVVANRADVALRADLDRVLADVLGARESDGSITPH